ncbi:MAG: hypothetical protein ACYSWS_00845 [Planctomycetota bacterium]|jgi:hypothetical protein
MEPQNTGSFGAATGGTDALKAAMERRGMDASVLDQVSASAPTGPSPVPGVPAETNIMTQTPQLPQTPKAPEVQPRSGEMNIALKAMDSVIKTENKIAEQVLGLR